MLDLATSVSFDHAYNGNGNVIESINSNGSGTAMLAAHFGYGPFGNLTAGTAANAAAPPFRSSTKPQDPVAGLLSHGHGWLDPLTGRWPGRPPIWVNGGANLYGFAGNSAPNHSDSPGNTKSRIDKQLKHEPKYRKQYGAD